jgi:prepilin-type N-terminal cleavage/methylation domain-containing protein
MNRRGLTLIECLVAVAIIAALALPRGAWASTVLLDEYWAPEITVNDVTATEVDTQVTGDPTQAKTGEFSACLENRAGAPSIRFRGAAPVKLADLPVAKTEARLWYRTTAWTGHWRFELWVYHQATDEAPVKVLQARLDGGGPDGALQPDDQWHQAKGLIEATGAYDRVPQDIGLVSYVWLAPEDGWDLPHRTFVDRCELIVLQDELDGKQPPPPAKHIRPHPSAQTNGPGWIWFEGEDAVQHNVGPGGPWAPETEEKQKLFSNDTWLHWGFGPDDVAILWEVNVAEAGTYTFWCRANGTAFKWAWDAAPFQACTEKDDWQDTRMLRQFPEGEVVVHWVRLGEVTLTAGKHLLQVQDIPQGEGFAFDCWLLTRKPFAPHGKDKPPAE